MADQVRGELGYREAPHLKSKKMNDRDLDDFISSVYVGSMEV